MGKNLTKNPAVKILLYKFCKIPVIQLRIFLIRKNPCQHGTGFHCFSGYRCIYRIIHKVRGILCALKSSECKVIIPWNHRQHALLFIQIIIMNHRTSITVKITDKIMYHKISDHFFHIHNFLHVLTLVQLPERCYKPVFIFILNFCFGILKNILVTVIFVI